MTFSKEDSKFVWDKVIRRPGGPPTKGEAKKQVRAEIRRRFPEPTAGEIKKWNSARDGNTAEMDTMDAYSERTGIPRSLVTYILQYGWMNSKDQLSLKGAVMAKKRKSTKGLGMFALTKRSAQRRRWTKVSSGQNPMFRVPRACAIVQSGEKSGKVRRGCKLTKNGAYCAELTPLPETAKIGPAKRRKDGRKRRRVVKCPDLT